MLALIGYIAGGCLLGYVAYGMWHSETVDTVKPRHWKKTWSAADQAEYDEMVNARQRGDA